MLEKNHKHHPPKIKCKFVDMIDKATIGKSNEDVLLRAGYDKNIIKRWRNQGRSPRVHSLEDVLNACGYELTMRKIE